MTVCCVVGGYVVCFIVWGWWVAVSAFLGGFVCGYGGLVVGGLFSWVF